MNIILMIEYFKKLADCVKNKFISQPLPKLLKIDEPHERLAVNVTTKNHKKRVTQYNVACQVEEPELEQPHSLVNCSFENKSNISEHQTTTAMLT
jgi:hypothetical protein